MSDYTRMKDSYIAFLKAQDRYAPLTLESYDSHIAEFLGTIVHQNPDLTDVSGITADMVEQWFLNHADWSPDTKQLHVCAVRGFCQYLTDKKVLAENPCSILRPIRKRHRINESVDDTREDKIYSSQDLLALLEFHETRLRNSVRDRAVIALMAATGMRASEIGWLNVGTFRSRKNGYIYALRKGQNIRKVFVAEFAIPYVEQYLSTRGAISDDDPLFITSHGNRFNRYNVDDILRSRQRKLGLRTGTHNIRYTVLNSVERFADPVVARDIAGHRSMAVTNRYMVASAEERARAVDNLPWAEKLEALAKNEK